MGGDLDQGEAWIKHGRVDVWVPWDYLEPPLSRIREPEQDEHASSPSNPDRKAEVLAHLSLILQLGHLAAAQMPNRQHVRLLTAAPRGLPRSDTRAVSKEACLQQWLRWARIQHGEVEVVIEDDSPSAGGSHAAGTSSEPRLAPESSSSPSSGAALGSNCVLSQRMRRHSSGAAVLFLVLPSLAEE